MLKINKEWKVVVGLGNPGRNFLNTRHNLGFQAIDHLFRVMTDKFLTSEEKNEGNFYYNKFSNGESLYFVLEEQRVFLLKPQLYMNNSGKCVKDFISYHQVPLSNLLVIYDDLSLPFSNIRLRQKGTSGGHNGILSLINHFGSTNILRLRLGIGQNPKIRYEDWVLQSFTQEEQQKLPEIFKKIEEIVLNWVEEKMDFQQLMSLFN